MELEPLWLAAWKAAFNVLHHGARAEDAADEALHRLTLECWRNDQEAARFAWIRTTAYRLAVDLRRTRGAETESWPPEVLDTQAAQSPTDNLETTRHASRWRARLEELRQQLKERLTPFQLKVLERVLLGWSNYLIAADLGVGPHEVRRARRAIVRWALKERPATTSSPRSMVSSRSPARGPAPLSTTSSRPVTLPKQKRETRPNRSVLPREAFGGEAPVGGSERGCASSAK